MNKNLAALCAAFAIALTPVAAHATPTFVNGLALPGSALDAPPATCGHQASIFARICALPPSWSLR